MASTFDLRSFEIFGLDVSNINGNDQIKTDCPFCFSTQHFFISSLDGRYHCKKCSEKGNLYTFLAHVYLEAFKATTASTYRELVRLRPGSQWTSFARAELAYHRDTHSWLIPIRNEEGSLLNLKRYQKGKLLNLPSLKAHVFNIANLKPTGPIYICEGEWDAIALSNLLQIIEPDSNDWSVLGVPGAGNFPSCDTHYIKNRDVFFLYDNDNAGRKGLIKTASSLSEIASSIHALRWPSEQFPEGFDIDSFIRQRGQKPAQLFQNILSWCHPFNAHAPDLIQQEISSPERMESSVKTIQDIVQIFQETGIHVYPSLIDCLALTLSVSVSPKCGSEPLWVYLIGDPGAGKSLVLEATLESPNCIYRTSITKRSFISGFTGPADTSLLAILPGKSLVIKDYSNILTLPIAEQEQLISLLREAYDGRVIQSYGNNVKREYPPPESGLKDCKFSMVAGVTKEIHSKTHAGLGERFLKFEVSRTPNDDRRAIRAAVCDPVADGSLIRSRAVFEFLSQDFNLASLPKLSDSYIDKIIALSRFVVYCRTPVVRKHGDLTFHPSLESGTRLAKQLKKLSESLGVVLKEETETPEIYRLVSKVAWDTAHSWRRTILLSLFQEKRATIQDLFDITGMSISTCNRQCQDMLALGIAFVSGSVSSKTKLGRRQNIWCLTRSARNLISSIGVEDHV